MTLEEYIQQHGYTPWKEGWEDLNDLEREKVKQQIPLMQQPGEGFTTEERDIMRDIWGRIQAGPDLDIWKGLSERLGLPAKAIKQKVLGIMGGLLERPDFGEEYGLKAGELERQWAERAAGRGLLDSSGAQAALGGGLANLMLGRAQMEEQSWMNRLGMAGNIGQMGMGFADALNTQYLQDLGLRGQALQYLTGERWNQNQANLAASQMWQQAGGWNPYTMTDFIGPVMNIGAALAGGGAFGGLGGGGGGGVEGWDPSLLDPVEFEPPTYGWGS